MDTGTVIGYFVLLSLGAALSQFAEWAHLSYTHKPWHIVYLGALFFVLFEYACSVTANRALYGTVSGFFLQIVWNFVQQITVNVYLYFFLHESYSRWNIASLVFLFAALLCAGVANRV